MNRKRWLILAAALVVTGGILFGGVMMSQNWNFLKLQTTQFKTNTHRIQTPYSNISINVDTADVVIMPTEDAVTTVECLEQEKVKHNVEVKDNTLTIQVMDIRAWYEHILLVFQSPRITVYLPKAEYEKVSINGSTADVKMESLTADTLNLSLSTGDMTVSNTTINGTLSVKLTTGNITMSDIQCENLNAIASTGDLHLQNVIANQEFSVEAQTGDLILEGCDAKQLWLKTTTGDIVGWLLSPKVFIAHTNTGDVKVPQTTEGGSCEIHTNTGDIDMDVLLLDITTP